jgi:flavocytochrome c
MELQQQQRNAADAIVVGTGLAGLTAALEILDRGGKVVLIDKEPTVGGNSIKASSGINACRRSENGGVEEDEIQSFVQDTIKAGAGGEQDQEGRELLVRTLVENSANALHWLKDRVGVDLLQNHTRLGGHSRDRTHRPSKGAVGYSIISAMQKALKPYEESGALTMRLSTRVMEIARHPQADADGKIILGVSAAQEQQRDGAEDKASTMDIHIEAPHVVLATGGFAANRSNDSLLGKYRPELLQMPATFGNFSTGDGIKMGTAIGAGTLDMDKVQIHPTDFVDPMDPSSPRKFLCAELMRGIGGILLNSDGRRFCNELGTRSYVTDLMLSYDSNYVESKRWDPSKPIPVLYLVLPAAASKEGGEHIRFYKWKQLLQPYKGISELGEVMGVQTETLRATLEDYQRAANEGEADEFGKTTFPNPFAESLEEEEFLLGKVSPVLHYCMGGLNIDTDGNVLDENRQILPGLHAAGEVAGGVHGSDRLAGNSLLECLVFGSIIGKKIPVLVCGSD